ncbi:MAG: pre-peptidase C-terminal domain-containing protein [Chloroflexota bacterium]
MRRQLLFLLILLLTTTMLVTAEGWRPPRPAAADPARPPLPEGFWDGPLAGGAADSCSAATTLDLSGGFDGGQTTVNAMTDEASDPVFSCLWGTPPGPRPSQGYRTVWYKVVAPNSGRLTVQANPNADFNHNYDTIVGIYEATDGSCGTLVPVACDDDSSGFLSQASAGLLQGKTYYIEVADWQFGQSDDSILSLSAALETAPLWQPAGTMPLPRSQHAAVVVGEDVYVLGGQTVVTGNPIRTPRVERFNPATGVWTTLNDDWGPDNLGYSSTTAVYLIGKIYLPSGYVGHLDTYDGTHWVYDIAGDNWTTAASAWAAGEEAVAWGAAVADPALNGYYLTGGLTGAFLGGAAVAHSEVYLYYADFDFWVETAAPMTTARYAHTAALVDGDLCVVGGIGTGNPAPLWAGGECYDGAVWRTIGNLNYPRYNAGSAVGDDGRWYVFGGVDAAGQAVAVTEVYDPATNSWTALDHRYDLLNPTRAWPRGGFINETLWVVGGQQSPGGNIVGLVDRLFVPAAPDAFLPFMAHSEGEPQSFAQSTRLTLNQSVQQGFDQPNDYFDVYSLTLAATQTVTARLTQIPAGSDYNLYLYDSNKGLLASGLNLSNLDEQITVSLDAGTYYWLVGRLYGQPTSSLYTIRVEG